MPDLTKTRTILTHSHSVERGPVFDAADEDGGRLTVITFDQSVWEDMGAPEEITVTIEPGDVPNEPSADDVSDARLAAAARQYALMHYRQEANSGDVAAAQEILKAAEAAEQPTGDEQ